MMDEHRLVTAAKEARDIAPGKRLEALQELERMVSTSEGQLYEPFPLDMDLVGKAYRGSLDAAKALHESVLPGWEWAINPHDVWVYIPTRNAPPEKEARASSEDSPARAWLLCIIKVLTSLEQESFHDQPNG